MRKPIRIAFEEVVCSLPLAKIIPQRSIAPENLQTEKYRLIYSSIKSVGLTKALVVCKESPDEYLLLDGHLRLDVLRKLDFNEVLCKVVTDDEAFIYKELRGASHIAEHFLIVKALKSGISEERLARALGVGVVDIRIRLDLLSGICPEVVQLLYSKKVALGVFSVLREMRPERQCEVAEHMIAGASYSFAFAKALLGATRTELLVDPHKMSSIIADSSKMTQRMLGIKSERLVKDLKGIEDSHCVNVLALTVFTGFIKKVLANPQVENYLSLYYSDLLDAVKEAIAD